MDKYVYTHIKDWCEVQIQNNFIKKTNLET